MSVKRRLEEPGLLLRLRADLGILVALMCLGSPAGCATHVDSLQTQELSQAALETGTATGPAEPRETSGPPAGYRLGPEDVFNVLVVGEPELTTVARVGRDGFVEMPLVGRILAAGLTVEELTERIEEALRGGYLANPDVQIILQQYRQDVVHLFGQVGTPGPFRLTHGDTLLEVISKAGGFTPIAKRKAVRILRKEGDHTRVIVVNVRRILDEGRLEEDVPLMPGDVVIVPERFF